VLEGREQRKLGEKRGLTIKKIKKYLVFFGDFIIRYLITLPQEGKEF